jgi:integrase
MALTDIQVRRTKGGEQVAKLSDGGGLQLWVTPDGAKRWRLAYRYNTAQKTLALGVYPAMSIRDARDARDAAKRILAAGEDPGHVRRVAKEAKAATDSNTFGALAVEFLGQKAREGKAEQTLIKVRWLLDFARPTLGLRPVAEITAAEVLRVLKGIEADGKLETANRLRATIGQVFRFAMATGRASADPTWALRGAIAAPIVQHRAAIIEPKAFGGLLRALITYEGSPETKAALLLLPLTFTRPGEMRSAEWAEFDLEACVWTIPGPKTKGPKVKHKHPHRIPLAPQSMVILSELQKLTGQGKFLFPSIRTATRCMSENTINAALRRLGFSKDEMCGHGFRSAASSMMNECGLWHPDAIERQLAHMEPNKVRRAYARADYWEERVRLMNWWADQCDAMRRGGVVIAMGA